ncbi:hypothetical protein UFOVP1464_29 [uncultured Caudovirales phage]|uniref:Uncharacterized protein n=1 Tax=uncultured Caudovirales phage TaxID=2100421 RepID=A0A6J5SIZ3_9CAUD|nr:hypothetical protein UFOVP1103_3 [uncultured Caudovirales phage]CAB4214268.1 hypothetical protein UFOVP1464_29 [uncultured Caudovirales phage]CAB5229378.1 hypothetical protein UFOVP1553_33 [uncultured Caudovirales phage]
MDIDLQRYYEDRFEMMASRGWLDFIEEMQKILDARDQLNAVNTEQQLHFAKGELSILSLIVNLQAVSEECHRSLDENIG